MKSSTILKKARKLIKSGEHTFICNAVHEAGGESVKRNQIVNFISDSLGQHPGLVGWIASNIDPEVYNATNYSKRIRQTRLNWIDWMIELYKAKGD